MDTRQKLETRHSSAVKRVLVAPLDWGLGHATRCIPIIHELQRQGAEVCLAGSGDALTLLRKEFAGLRSFLLPGYAPQYPYAGSMAWKMARQLPHFIRVIRQEHRALKNILAGERFDLIISDNRYGFWSAEVRSVFITHQSNIMMPKRFGWLHGIVRKVNERMINHFHACWVPDLPGAHALAGDLILQSAPKVKFMITYIGALSRFEPRAPRERKWDVVAIFSGPEPQRSVFEKIVVAQLAQSGLKYRAIRGLPALESSPDDGDIVNYLGSSELQDCIEAAHLIIARSGYSTVMDMHALGHNVVFVPTPGQTEQEYLAETLMKKGIAFSMKQSEFDLRKALEQSRQYSGFIRLSKNTILHDVLTRTLQEPAL